MFLEIFRTFCRNKILKTKKMKVLLKKTTVFVSVFKRILIKKKIFPTELLNIAWNIS